MENCAIFNIKEKTKNPEGNSACFLKKKKKKNIFSIPWGAIPTGSDYNICSLCPGMITYQSMSDIGPRAYLQVNVDLLCTCR